MSRWGVALAGCKARVKQLPLKGNGETRGRPSRCRAWLRGNRVSATEADFDLREIRPLPRNILPICGVEDHGTTGQRANLKLGVLATGCRGWLVLPTSPKVSTANLIYSVDARDTAKSGIGHLDNRHLHYLAESFSVNVGGSHQNGKASSRPRSAESVGGVIVVGARESRAHGEGHQEFNVPLYSLTATVPGIWDKPQGAGGERERDKSLNSGEPGAVKVARRVRKGG